MGYLDKFIRPLVLIMPKMSGYVRKFKVKDGNKDKKSKLMSFRIDDKNVLEKYEAIWNKIEDLENIEINALPVYDERSVKTKVRTWGDKVYANFRGINVPEDDRECDSITVISIDFLRVYDKKYYLQVCLDNCFYKIVNKQMTEYLDDNLLEN